jgi:pyrroloquinoline quinone (PQQ) biosynthesis protein C
VPELSRRQIEGLRKHFPVMDPAALAFLELHADKDDEHAAAWERLLREGCSDEYSRNAAIEAAARAANALWHLLDGIHHVYVDLPAQPAVVG